MLERVTVKTLPLATRYGEHAPMATVCCNACRACVQTNALAAVVAASVWALSFVKRPFRR
ncbi:MAG TPA: hypothetical protein VFW80_03655 [Gaiellaceae bacterium]|nr:hypothetical protein [Gaiellaceae bacterium]